MIDSMEVTNLRLNGRKELVGDIVQECEEQYCRFKLKKIVGQKVFPMHEATVEQIQGLRKKKTPTFVLRDGYRLFYAIINNSVNFTGNQIITRHKCNEGGCCGRLSAAQDIDGGCAKVRMNCKGIERFPWLDFAFEVFNTATENMLLIARCDRYEKATKKAKAKKSFSIVEYAWSASHGAFEINQSGKKGYDLNFF